MLREKEEIWELKKDGRDMNHFWTLWAAIIFGAITIVLSVIQIGLATAQVVVAFK